MENLEDENVNLRAENAMLIAAVDRLTSLVKTLLVAQARNNLHPPPPTCVIPPRTGGPRRRRNGPRQVATVMPVVNATLARQRPDNRDNHERVNSFDPIPITYTELYPMLIQKNWVQTRNPPAIPKKLPWWYKQETSCAFHQGAPGHDLNNCMALKIEVQKLMRAGILTFEGTRPNVDMNLLPNH